MSVAIVINANPLLHMLCIYLFSFQVFYNIVALSVAIVINANPLLHMLCIYILWEEPTSTDIMGKYLFNP